MNVEEYIASGILEAYAIGEVNEAERRDVERMLSQHPEVREELARVEETLEAVAFATGVSPKEGMREKILSAARPAAKVVPISATWWKFAAAASIAIALMTSYMAFHYRQQWQQTELALNQLTEQNVRIANNYNVVNEKLDKLQGDLHIIESPAFTKVVMTGTLNDKEALASVYWNAKSNEVFLSIQQLKAIAKENQFQLWAIVEGKTVDAGVFDGDFAGLLKMKSIAGAAAFAITVEPRGGSVNPTLGTMQVIGTVPS